MVQIYNQGAKNGLKVLATVFFFFLLKVKQSFKYLNDNAGVTLNPFSRFINWSRKNEGNESEKFKPLNKRRGSEREKVRWKCVCFEI